MKSWSDAVHSIGMTGRCLIWVLPRFDPTYRRLTEDDILFTNNHNVLVVNEQHIETAIMMIKAKFGDSVRSKTEVAMKNEVLAKTLCHNIYVLIRGIYDDGLAVEFFPKTEDAAD